MSARLVWITTCDVCETATNELPGGLTVEELGVALRGQGWELPRYGGTFCPRCSNAVKTLSDKTP